MGGDPDGVKHLVQELLASPLLSNAGIQVAEQNLRAHALKSGGGKLWQARLRTRDLMRIMDCVQVSCGNDERALVCEAALVFQQCGGRESARNA